MVFAGYNEGELELIKGAPKKYASSEKVTRSFCSECGSPFSCVYNESPDQPFISLGLFDDPSGFKLQEHIFVGSKLPWINITDELPQKD